MREKYQRSSSNRCGEHLEISLVVSRALNRQRRVVVCLRVASFAATTSSSWCCSKTPTWARRVCCSDSLTTHLYRELHQHSRRQSQNTHSEARRQNDQTANRAHSCLLLLHFLPYAVGYSQPGVLPRDHFPELSRRARHHRRLRHYQPGNL